MASIQVSKSRFALLKVEDDSDNETKHEKKSSDKETACPKKKNKKKKKNESTADKADLQHLAFGKPGVKQTSKQANKQKVPDKQWEEWKKVDTEFTTEVYEKDLQEAMLESKLQFEQDKHKKKETPTSNGTNDTNAKESNKKKKKKEKNVMSLEQFNKLNIEDNNQNADEEGDWREIPSPAFISLPVDTKIDTTFFEKVNTDVNKALQKEKIQEEYQKHYALESAMTTKFREDLISKDKEITELKASVEKFESELKQVKKRNKQLCHILAQGEMKDKAEVLSQVEDLSQVKDELTEQISELNIEIEKEKSKNHALKSELDRIKGSKGGK